MSGSKRGSRADRTDATAGSTQKTSAIGYRAARSAQAATTATRIAAEAMNEQRNNVDWTAVFAIAARAGPRELVRALATAMEHECTALAEKYDASLARQRATCDEILAQERATWDEILAQERAEFEQHYAALRHELNELRPVVTTLRRELTAAHAELARLRAAQPAR